MSPNHFPSRDEVASQQSKEADLTKRDKQNKLASEVLNTEKKEALVADLCKSINYLIGLNIAQDTLLSPTLKTNGFTTLHEREIDECFVIDHPTEHGTGMGDVDNVYQEAYTSRTLQSHRAIYIGFKDKEILLIDYSDKPGSNIAKKPRGILSLILNTTPQIVTLQESDLEQIKRNSGKFETFSSIEEFIRYSLSEYSKPFLAFNVGPQIKFYEKVNNGASLETQPYMDYKDFFNKFLEDISELERRLISKGFGAEDLYPYIDHELLENKDFLNWEQHTQNLKVSYFDWL